MHALILTLSFYLCFPWCTARTDILWPTLLRSRGCSTRRWRKTLSSAALSVNRGEDRGFLCGAGWSRALRGSCVVPGTRLWLTPAHCSPTSTFCPSGTKLRSESGYALMFPVRFNALLLDVTFPLLWCFRGLTWAEVRGRGSAWPELFTRTPTSSSWWAQLYQSSSLKHPRWWWQSKYFPYYSIASSLEELQPPFLSGWFQDSVHVGLWDEEVSASWFRSSCVYLAKWLRSEYSVATLGFFSYLADVLHLTAGVLLCTRPRVLICHWWH